MTRRTVIEVTTTIAANEHVCEDLGFVFRSCPLPAFAPT